MTTEQLYKKAEHADEIADLDLKDASREEIIGATYHAWLDTLPRYEKPLESVEQLYEAACRIVRPFKKMITGELAGTEVWKPIKDYPGPISTINAVSGTGIYISALLNETDITKVTIDGNLPLMSHVGYRLGYEKAVEVGRDGDVWDIFEEATCGVAINRGNVRQMMGCKNRGGVLVNLGQADHLGYNANGGTFLNFSGDPNTIGWGAQDGVFVSRIMPSSGHFLSKYDFGGPAYGVKPEELKMDKDLDWMMSEVEKSAMASDISAVAKLGKAIDQYVRANYKPRKVA